MKNEKEKDEEAMKEEETVLKIFIDIKVLLQ
jgi:hypothetical protein